MRGGLGPEGKRVENVVIEDDIRVIIELCTHYQKEDIGPLSVLGLIARP